MWLNLVLTNKYFKSIVEEELFIKNLNRQHPRFLLALASSWSSRDQPQNTFVRLAGLYRLINGEVRILAQHLRYVIEKDQIDYLRLIIHAGSVSMNPVKVKAVTTWSTPKCLKDVHAFIGFANFYCHFIKDFSKLAHLLHDLTKKDIPFT